jgi:hypothetical protein
MGLKLQRLVVDVAVVDQCQPPSHDVEFLQIQAAISLALPFVIHPIPPLSLFSVVSDSD